MSDIIVKFKPQGEKRLIAAIRKLELAQGGATVASNKHRLAIGRNRKSMAMYARSNSPLAAVRKTKSGANLKRWFKEEWKDEKGNVCGSEKNKNTKVCRPSKRVNSESPKSWGEMSSSEKRKVTRAKKKVGMGRRRDSSSNVS